MTPGARLAAAAEILQEIFALKAAADRTISAWGKAHRFAGSKDRAAIGQRVYAVLRRLNECAFAMESRLPRALVIGSLKVVDHFDAEQIGALCVDGAHALGALSNDELLALAKSETSDRPWISLNYPEWLHEELFLAFGQSLEAELHALSGRAPMDLRVNTLKARRADIIQELEGQGLSPRACKTSATAVRLEAGSDVKVNQLPCYIDGRVEVQDESSQIAIGLAGASAGETVVDLAAGGGGKAIGLAADMRDKGRLFVCDVGAERLERMIPRINRAGVSVIEFAGNPYAPRIHELVGEGADLVFVDAPCSGSGTWRRNPESKWTLSPERLDTFRAAQVSLLERAGVLSKSDGRIVYAVCSVLRSEGIDQVTGFCERNAGWQIGHSVSLTPLRSGTDGFFAAELRRSVS